MEKRLTVYEYGDPSSDTVLFQMVDGQFLSSLEKETGFIREKTGRSFKLKALMVKSWNDDLSPWKAPAVFGNETFGGGAGQILPQVIDIASQEKGPVYIGGYSLAGLFALLAAYQTDIFTGVAAVSPSVWFPGFIDYMRDHEIRTAIVDLSLGDKEEKTKNPVISTVGSNIREAYDLLLHTTAACMLTWNKGNHFKDAELRTAEAFARLLNGS
ncbi:MAG: esterase [Lachnospiraceae bacterium]|nr:esterase [Lachnospiraceae bacterium]